MKIRASQVEINQLVSNGGQIITVQPELASVIEVLPMNTVVVKILTAGHKGALALNTEYLPRQEGDISIYVHTA